MTCLSENVLSAFVEGRLLPGELPLLHAHLDECPDCRALVARVVGGTLDGSAATILPSGAPAIGAADPVSDGDARLPVTERAPSGPPRVEGYRIVRRIGRGAMGEVYLAQDEQLDRPVAIKFLSATSEPTARKRFLLEARAVARLRHPHIVTIYSSDITGERPYIVSELLSGKSLDRIEVPLTRGEAVRIAVALASGLAAAHRQGVLHRDLKPANAIRTDEGEIKLLDFGLAKLTNVDVEPEATSEPDPLAHAEVVRRTMTRTGVLVGTPLYMAPEVWRGEPATPASDVYSLGAMLYELCAGAPARRAMTMDALRREIGESTPRPLRQVARSIDPALAAAIDRCLSHAPEHRFPSAVELWAALDTIAAKNPEPGRARRALLAAAGALAVLGVGVAVARGTSASALPVSLASTLDETAAASTRRSVVIMPIVNATGSPEAAWLSTALSEALGTCLAAGESLRIIPGAEMARMSTDLELRGRASLGEEELRRIRQYAAVDVVVTGTFGRAERGSGLRARVVLQNTRSGAVIAAGEAEGTEPAFQAMALLLGERLLSSFGQLPISATQAAQVRAAMPSSLLAARLYAEGLERHRADDNEGARERFERAAQAEPESPMPHYWLGTLWASLGQEESERREAKLAFERASGLLREQRLQIEARYYRTHLDKSRALETLHMLHELFPDNVENGIELAIEQPREEGLATLARLRKLPPPAGEDPRVDIAEYHVGAVTDDRIRAAQRATATGRARGARLIVGTARNLEGWGAWDQGDIDLAQEAWSDALAILQPRGHIVDATESMRGLAAIAVLKDDLDAALAHFEAAEAHLRRAGNHASLIFALRNVAAVLRLMGSPEEGRPRIDEALAISERSGNRTRLAQAYVSVGILEDVEGHLPAARQAFERALAIFDELKDPRLVRGAHGEAAELHVAADELDVARDHLEHIIAQKDAEGRKRATVTHRRQLARVAIEQGQLDEAASLLDVAMAEAEREKAPIEIALIGGARGRASAARGDRVAAISAVDDAMERVAFTKNLFARMQVTLDWAHVHALVGDPAQRSRAERGLEEALVLMRDAGFGIYMDEARFIACELLSARASRARALGCFSAVAEGARARGFLRIARKASEQAR